MPFREAYFRSLDAVLSTLQRQLDEIAAVTTAFHHLSVARDEQPETGPVAAPRAPRPKSPRQPLTGRIPRVCAGEVQSAPSDRRCSYLPQSHWPEKAMR